MEADMKRQELKEAKTTVDELTQQLKGVFSYAYFITILLYSFIFFLFLNSKLLTLQEFWRT